MGDSRHQSCNREHKMKLFLVALCIISVAFADQKAPVECELCQEAAGKLFSHLGSTWTDHTIALLIGHLCHHAEDTLTCIEEANIWWPYIAKILYADESAKYVCNDLSYGVCPINKVTWDCDHCKTFITSIAHSYIAHADALVEMFQGIQFCENPLIELDEAGQEGCKKSIEWFLPRALYVVDYDLHHEAHHMCRDWYHGICQGHPHHPLIDNEKTLFPNDLF